MNALALTWPATALREALHAHWPDAHIDIWPQAHSTNSELMQRARHGDTRPTLLVAEQQLAGHGRQGRTWHSGAAGDALTFSLGLPLPANAPVAGLSLAVGCSLCHSLDAQGNYGLRIKWPNDLWHNQRKLGGILVEICTAGRNRYCVIGVGLNLACPPAFDNAPAHTPSPIPAQAPAWLRELDPHASAPQTLLRTAPALAQAIRQFMHDGLTPWQRPFVLRDALAGRSVWLSDGDSGTAQGIADNGALRIRTAQGHIRTIINDDISVRPTSTTPPHTKE